MSIFGRWQLRSLKFLFCDIGGSSRGARDYIGNVLKSFIIDNPQINVEITIKRGHPVVIGKFVNGNSRVVVLKNFTTKEIERQIYYLRNSTGRKTDKKIMRHKTITPSIQGKWTPWTVDPIESRRTPKYVISKKLEVTEEEKGVIVYLTR